ncbi:MAG: hypothetical protein HY054_08675 [Proteobacteria bacterium]|nr:hypothetical protein [Pseudomonadota bacterium]
MAKSVALGDLLAFSRSSSADIRAWLKDANSTLAERVDAQATMRGESVAQFVRIAVADFMAEADEEAWASLMSALRNATDPGAACLETMTEFRITMELAA